MYFTLMNPHILYMEKSYGPLGHVDLMNDTKEFLYSPRVSSVFQLVPI